MLLLLHMNLNQVISSRLQMHHGLIHVHLVIHILQLELDISLKELNTVTL